MKKEAERSLKRLLDVHHGEAKPGEALQQFVQGPACAGPDAARALRETFRKTLSVLPEQSDDEDAQW